jgi:arylsulfatase A-like enzyme
MSGPGIPRGGRSDALVYGFDIFPTLCSLLNIGAPSSIEGKSLNGILTGDAKAVRDSSFHTYIHRTKGSQHAVNDGRWKFIRYDVQGTMHIQLFDLHNDPDEIHDLSKDSAAAGELSRLEKLLARWQADLAEPELG